MKLYTCPQCGSFIGKIEMIEELELLNVNGIYCRELRGFCGHCQAKIVYSASDAFILKLISRNKTNKSNCI